MRDQAIARVESTRSLRGYASIRARRASARVRCPLRGLRVGGDTSPVYTLALSALACAQIIMSFRRHLAGRPGERHESQRWASDRKKTSDVYIVDRLV